MPRRFVPTSTQRGQNGAPPTEALGRSQGRVSTTVHLRERNRVERLIDRRKHVRRLVTRYGKRAAYHQAVGDMAVTLLWL